MSKCDHNSLFHKKIRFIRNTLITNVIDQRSRTDGCPIKLIQSDVDRLIDFVGSAVDDKQGHLQLVCMRIELCLSQRARALMVGTAAAAIRTKWRSDNIWQGVAKNCRMVVADCLIADPACVNKRNVARDSKGKYRYDFTPLMLSCACRNLEMCDFLLRSGADVNATGGDTGDKLQTALMVASGEGNLEICHFLLRNGADVNARNSSQMTPLMLAVANGHLEIVKLLVASKADVSAKDRSNQTVFAQALKHKARDIEAYRRAHGCVVPANYAVRNKYAEVVAYLKSIKAPQ